MKVEGTAHVQTSKPTLVVFIFCGIYFLIVFIMGVSGRSSASLNIVSGIIGVLTSLYGFAISHFFVTTLNSIADSIREPNNVGSPELAVIANLERAQHLSYAGGSASTDHKNLNTTLWRLHTFSPSGRRLLGNSDNNTDAGEMHDRTALIQSHSNSANSTSAENNRTKSSRKGRKKKVYSRVPTLENYITSEDDDDDDANDSTTSSTVTQPILDYSEPSLSLLVTYAPLNYLSIYLDKQTPKSSQNVIRTILRHWLRMEGCVAAVNDLRMLIYGYSIDSFAYHSGCLEAIHYWKNTNESQLKSWEFCCEARSLSTLTADGQCSILGKDCYNAKLPRRWNCCSDVVVRGKMRALFKVDGCCSRIGFVWEH